MAVVPLSAWIAIAVFSAVCGFAFWKGAAEERIAGAALALAVLATPILKDHRFLGPQWGIFAVDAILLSLLLAIAMRTKRWWPLCAAAFQLLGILTHVAEIVDPSVRSWAYVTAGVIWTYALLAAIVVGTWNRWRERRQPAGIGVIAAPGATRR